MAKTVYRRKTLEPELGFIGAQNWLSAQANRVINNPVSSYRVVRVWTQCDGRKILDEVIIAS
ncbi:MAG: hypothetical protein E7L15_17665 [Citrobacter portucalensis]|nr:hypothetical protein [Citrobacter portucalensis]